MRQLLLLCEYPTLNGGEHSMLSTLEGVGASGFVPAAIAPSVGPLADALRSRGIELLPFESRDDAGRRLSQRRLREALHRLLRRRRPALLHANSLSMGRLSGPVVAELGVPSIAHLRDVLRLSRQAVADLNCHRRLLAVSRATREFHVAGGLAAEKTHVLYNGVDLKRFCPRPPCGYLHRELGIPPERPLIGTVGQIGLRKGQDVLLRAAVALADELPGADYLVVGERFSEKDESLTFEAELHAMAGGPLSGRVHFLGLRQDMERILNELTLLVHPARQEPLGRVLLEAAASGVAVVATEVGGTAEIFPCRSQSARLVPPDDVEALCAAIRELAVDEAQRSRLARAARSRAEAALDVRRAAEGLVEHYREVGGM